MTVAATLTAVDYVVATIILLVPVVIGIWYAVKDAHKATRDEYLLGGRRMSIIPVGLSIFITFQSAISLMGSPSEVYFYGAIYAVNSVGLAGSYLIGYFTVVPLMYPLQLTSIYEYLKLRYNSEAVRMLGTSVGMLTTACYMAIALLTPALALQASADIPLWLSIAGLGAVGTLYTAMGGLKSVVWTDAFQTLVIFIGIFAIIVKACVEVGGVGEVWRLSVEGGRTNFDRFSPDPRVRHTVISLMTGYVFVCLVNAFNQSTLQRVVCMKDVAHAKFAYLLTVPLSFVYISAVCFVGLAIYAYYAHLHCDPDQAGFISNRNQLAPYFVLNAMQDIPGMGGLFISVLCCGSLSTLSSGMNALAANTVEDVLRKPLRSLQESTITLITKLLVVFYGGVIVGLTYLAKSLKGPVPQMANSAFGAFGSPILGIFLMGGAVPWANKYGAFAGLAVSLAFNLWTSLGSVLRGISIEALPSPGTAGCSSDSSGGGWVRLQNSSLFPAAVTAVTAVTAVRLGALPTTVTDAGSSLVLSATQGYSSSSPALTNTTTSGGYDDLHTTAIPPPHQDSFFLYDVSYEWYSLMGIIVCAVVGLCVSYITNWAFGGSREFDSALRPADARFIFPWLRGFWAMKNPDVELTVQPCVD